MKYQAGHKETLKSNVLRHLETLLLPSTSHFLSSLAGQFLSKQLGSIKLQRFEDDLTIEIQESRQRRDKRTWQVKVKGREEAQLGSRSRGRNRDLLSIFTVCTCSTFVAIPLESFAISDV